MSSQMIVRSPEANRGAIGHTGRPLLAQLVSDRWPVIPIVLVEA